MITDKHVSTMTEAQRKELIRILKHEHDVHDLATMTDPQLHEAWLIMCEYENVYK